MAVASPAVAAVVPAKDCRPVAGGGAGSSAVAGAAELAYSNANQSAVNRGHGRVEVTYWGPIKTPPTCLETRAVSGAAVMVDRCDSSSQQGWTPGALWNCHGGVTSSGRCRSPGAAAR